MSELFRFSCDQNETPTAVVGSIAFSLEGIGAGLALAWHSCLWFTPVGATNVAYMGIASIDCWTSYLFFLAASFAFLSFVAERSPMLKTVLFSVKSVMAIGVCMALVSVLFLEWQAMYSSPLLYMGIVPGAIGFLGAASWLAWSDVLVSRHYFSKGFFSLTD